MSSNTTINTYDDARRVAATTTPGTAATLKGTTTAYTYDPAGRVLHAQQSANNSILRAISATYTLTGKPATTTDANANVTRYAYDQLDRLISVTDAMNRATKYTYDTLSRQTQVSNLAIQASPLLQQAFTLNGVQAALTDANNNATSFTYDGFDRLTTTVYPDTSYETFAYDTDGNVVSRGTRAGQPIAFAYDTLNRLVTKTPPVPWPAVSYSYDLANRPTDVSDNSASIAAAVPPGGSTVAYTTNYTYDARSRPTSVTWDPAPVATPPAAGPLVTFGHSYNAANQRIGQTVDDNSWLSYPTGALSTTNYTANNLNQYTAVTGLTPAYDSNGNLTGDGTYILGYDAENRLTSASGSGNSSTYAFDARGRRKSRTINGTTTISVTDAANREVLEYNGSTGTLLRWYAYGLGPNDVLNQMSVAAATRAVLVPDLVGSVVATFDSSGTLTKAAYQPYGSSAAAASPFAYTGQRIDSETGGNYYYRARHYSPVLGRFLQADPAGYSAGPHLYAYVANDPLNAADSSGLTPDPHVPNPGAPIPESVFYDAWLSQLSDVTQGSVTPALGSLEAHATLAAGLVGGPLVRGVLGIIGIGSATTGGLSPAEQLAANKAAGAAFEQAVGASLERSGLTVGEQVTIQTQSGVRTRLDFLTQNPSTGRIGCIECKASPNAPLTPNQTLAFPEIGQSGGTIVGAGKPAFPGGLQLPPTTVEIIRGP